MYLTIAVIVSGCASYKAKYADKTSPRTIQTNKELVHSFYLIGDAGNAEMGQTTPTLKYFQEKLAKATKNATTIFLGDNIYPYGIPNKNHKDRALAEHRLQTQIDALQDFKGKTIFIPGNHDWYNGVNGLKRQEKMVEKALGKNSFLPEGGCGLDKVKINDDLTLILIDSRWFIMNWDKEPKMNDNCDIKTRERFIQELSSLFKKNRYKNVVVAVHHPLYSNGPHGGSFSVKDHMKPAPILGTLKNALRSHAGIQTDIFNKNYSDFINQIQAVSDDFTDNVVFVSGHDHNLQYIEQDGFKQVISGSGSKQSAALVHTNE